MTTKIDNQNEPAMPFVEGDGFHSQMFVAPGMTKRELVLLRMMQGILSNSSYVDTMSDGVARSIASDATVLTNAYFAELDK